MIDNPLVRKWAPFANDDYVLMEDRQLGMATSAPNPLSIPWSLDQLTALIDDALAD